MESTIIVSADKLRLNEKDVIVINASIPPSEIPYYVVLNYREGKINIRNEYISKREEILKTNFSTNLNISYGKNSGRIYEVNSIQPQRKQDLIESISGLCKKLINIHSNQR